MTAPASQPLILSRGDAQLAARLETANAVLLDVPAGVPPLCAATTAGLRRLGIPVTHSTDDRLRRAATAVASRRAGCGDRSTMRIRPDRRRVAAVLTGTALTVAAAGGGWAAQVLKAQPSGDTATRLLVDGGVAVRVPAPWTVERVTSGSGSARVRVSAPGGVPALHITQSADPGAGTIADVAESLRRAIDSEPDGVFVDFDPSAERGAGRQ